MITLDSMRRASQDFKKEKEDLDKLIQSIEDEELKEALNSRIEETLTKLAMFSELRILYEAQFQTFSGSVKCYKNRFLRYIKTRIEKYKEKHFYNDKFEP